MAYRTGKLGQGVAVSGSAGGFAEDLKYPIGSQISGNNYARVNLNQGSISFWIKPQWNGNDGIAHYAFAVSNLTISKTTANNLRLIVTGFGSVEASV